jgi:phosphoenolpyruvate carboxylase
VSRRAPLEAEIERLWRLLAQIVEEQEGSALRRLVERTRRRTVRGRAGDAAAAAALVRELGRLEPSEAEVVARTFLVHFRLANLAEERHRVRVLEQRGRRLGRAGRAGQAAPDDTLAGVIRSLREAGRFPSDPAAAAEAVSGLRLHPVLTAHPTEARRRTALLALGRVARILATRDDPRLPAAAAGELDDRLREELAILWRTAEERHGPPTPLDEVRTSLASFDATLYTLVPALGRSLRTAIGLRPGSGIRLPAVMRWGSWVGADRDGNPGVTAEVTRHAARIAADHVLRGHEAVASRLMQTIAVVVPEDRLDADLRRRLLDDDEALPDLAATLRRRFPDEPYRRRFGAIAERLRRTRHQLTDERGPTGGRYASAEALEAEIVELQRSLVALGLDRVAEGSVEDFRWQVETFGFHLAELEVRQHAVVHRAAVALLAAGADPEAEAAPGVSLGEVIGSFRAVERIRSAFGPRAAGRIVVSFSEGLEDVLAVLDLAERAGGRAASAALDVVPLFESASALERADRILEAMLGDARYRAHLRGRAGRQEVMLGYSDSNKESGFVAANWLLHRAQAALARTARAAGVELTLFHGRGGALGRGGGRLDRAVLGQPPGTVGGRLKVTEQGEVVAARYGNPAIALRHLELLAGAIIVADHGSHYEPTSTDMELLERLSAASRAAYRRLVYDDPGFGGFFSRITPIEFISSLRLGSRPASRAAGADDASRDHSIERLRAIPWGFAWSQARLELPGWYGLGAALEDLRVADGDAAIGRLAELYRRWPFLAAVVDHAELALARTDLGVARRYAALAGDPGDAERFTAIVAEHARSVEAVLAVTGRDRLLAAAPTIARTIALRNPDVDALAELQVGTLGRLRTMDADDPRRPTLERLVRLTISGIAAGLQVTG